MTAAIVAFGAVSAQGRGRAAFACGDAGEPAKCLVARDPELAAAGLCKPFAARVPDLSLPETHDRARELLRIAALELRTQLERELPDYRSRRVGLVIGTSGGGMPSFQRAMLELSLGRTLSTELARATPYFGPLSAIDAVFPVDPALRVQILAACASSTFALGHALAWLESGVAELVIAGGYDALSSFIAAGFEALGATCATPTPFRLSRAGLALGEGAALVALVPTASAPKGWVLGFGASSDAVHVTAPDRTGSGLARAAEQALTRAGCGGERLRLVNAHGTGTSYNDAAEALAIDRALGTNASAAVVHALKGTLGHTLGAAGVLEVLSAIDALERRLAPATHGSGEVEPALRARLLDRTEAASDGLCLKLSSAFGGANAALVLGRDAAPAPIAPLRQVALLAVAPAVESADAASLTGRVLTEPMKLRRMDPLSLLSVGAALGVSDRCPLGPAAGVIVGTAMATLEQNAAFERQRLARGAEPRRFPATSPNLCAGEVSIALGLHGPSFSVGAGPSASLEALLVAHDWIASGWADQLVVIAAESVGVVASGLWQAAGWPLPAHGAAAAVLGVATTQTPLARQRLADAARAAQAADGALGGRLPGWPTFLEALAGLGP
ncbi:MAG: 3-oxoacyl-ACP synthase [Myxococcales bacterium]|nr:3-oxoacyl-ACP synthase [Myxococcales bacterium]